MNFNVLFFLNGGLNLLTVETERVNILTVVNDIYHFDISR